MSAPRTAPVATRDNARLEALARALDAAVRIPGTNVRLGLDALIGLVPGVGDVTGAVLSGIIVLAGVRQRAPASVLAMMLLNILIDTTLGAVPVIGDVFDVAWRANLRNVALLQRHAAEPARTRAASGATVAAVVVALVLLLVAGLAASVWLLSAIVRALHR
jgi:hypothetical protein